MYPNPITVMKTMPRLFPDSDLRIFPGRLENSQMDMKTDCEFIVHNALRAVYPEEAVSRALQRKSYDCGKLILVSVGKAAWSMANAAWNTLTRLPDTGIIITKYGQGKGEIGHLEIWEAGHPLPDHNTYSATQRALEMTEGLTDQDHVLFLLSGGGSALFEKPLISEADMISITEQLLGCGAEISEINVVRKRLSAVKGGRFAEHCAPAKIFSIVLSDVIGNRLENIASGPACDDPTTSEQALEIVHKYGLQLSKEAYDSLRHETPKHIANVETVITGSVTELCNAAASACESLGYHAVVLTDSLTCQAREAGAFLAAIARYYQKTDRSLAFLAGGETVVKLTGSGKGGRNQEIVLSAAEGISGLRNTAVFSLGSDGTDGPTDAAGGFVTGETANKLSECGISIYDTLQNNDAYHALAQCNGLLITGATGTNVNDVSVILIRRPDN